jgi:hypothetical protein
MTSLQTSWKQVDTRSGYYVPVGDCRTRFYANTGSDAAPVFNNALMLTTMSTSGGYVSTLIASAGAGVFRDHGKTLTSSGRVFRKVQLLVSTNSVLNGGTDGVGGTATTGANSVTPSYLTGYIELPGPNPGASGPILGNGVGGGFTPVARLG